MPKPQPKSRQSALKRIGYGKIGIALAVLVVVIVGAVFLIKGLKKAPEVASNVECVPVADAKLVELGQQGYSFIGRPVAVTRNGEEQIQLDQPATVSFNIPKEYPKDKYSKLKGVLITGEGASYLAPDDAALNEGIAKFEINHLGILGLTYE